MVGVIQVVGRWSDKITLLILLLLLHLLLCMIWLSRLVRLIFAYTVLLILQYKYFSSSQFNSRSRYSSQGVRVSV